MRFVGEGCGEGALSEGDGEDQGEVSVEGDSAEGQGVVEGLGVEFGVGAKVDAVAKDDVTVVRVEAKSGTGQSVVEVVEEAQGLGAREFTRLDGVDAVEEDQVILLHVDDAERVVSVIAGEAQDDRLGRVLKQRVAEVLRC